MTTHSDHVGERLLVGSFGGIIFRVRNKSSVRMRLRGFTFSMPTATSAAKVSIWAAIRRKGRRVR